MVVPLILLRPLACGEQDDQLADFSRQGGLVAKVLPDSLQAPRQLGTSQKRDERTVHRPARPGGDLIMRLLLRRGHLLASYRWQSLVRHRVRPKRSKYYEL